MFAMSKREKKKLPKLLPSCQRLLRAWSIGLYKLIPSKQLNWHINYHTLYYGKDDTAHFKICPGLGGGVVAVGARKAFIDSRQKWWILWDEI